jgi:site-specific DNA-cytosine methylase
MTLVPIKNPERIKERTTYYQFDVSGKGYNSQQDRVRKLDKPSGTLAAQAASIPKILCREKSKTVRTGGRGSYDRHEWDSVGNKGTELYYRKLTPTECERLQTVPDGYTEGVSNTQRYRMLGNGWTVEVIKHIFSEIR